MLPLTLCEAIARAVYARKEFTILDDVFNGLDPATEVRVFNNLFGTDGLLRRGDQTVVLAVSSGIEPTIRFFSIIRLTGI